MENATKVLLIAGAVLVTIIIISIVMYIINVGASSNNGGAEIDDLERQTFNNKYEVYAGNRSANMVKTVLQYAINDNEARNASSVYKKINIRSNATDILQKFSRESEMTRALNGTRDYGVILSSNITRIKQALNSKKKYKLWFSYDRNGYIWEIHIDDPN